MTQEETDFIRYWEENRLSKKKVLKQLYVGLPLGVVLISTIFINLLSGWYSRAQMEMARESSSLIVVLLVAALAIVVFIVIFSARHRWDINEQHYRELKARKKNS